MSLNEATYERLYREQSRRLEFIEKSLKVLAMNSGFNKWMSEEEVMIVTGLKERSLRDKRKAGIFNWTSATGRKPQYLRTDVMAYLDKNSTLSK